MKDGSCPEIKLEQIQSAIEDRCGAILRQIHNMITLSYKISGNHVSVHAANPKRVKN